MSHGDQVHDAGRPTSSRWPRPRPARSPRSGTASRPVYGLQFHPEVAHTPYGTLILGNFLDRICQQPAHLDDGGVHRAVGRRDRPRRSGRPTGSSAGSPAASIRRSPPPCWPRRSGRGSSASSSTTACSAPGERAAVAEAFGGHSTAELRVVDASERFLDALHGVTDPQEKRVRIGHTFIDVFRDEARSIPGARFLAQGTLYPDVIESGGDPDGPAATIKHHHNVGGLPAELGFELIEPLRDLFKDEVRRLGLELGLPDTLVWRHPFPGPGLAVRCLGEVTAARLEVLRQADAIFLDELRSGRPRPPGRPGLRRAPADPVGRRDGRRPHLRERRSPSAPSRPTTS